jgi:hypothetical protein
MSPTQRTSELEPCGCTQDRLSTGNGRVYLIVVKATDAGGTGFGTATAAVPTSSSSTNMAAVNAEAAAAKTAAAANHGTRRGGYSVVGDHRPPVRPRASAAVRRARCRRGIGHSTRRGTTGRGDSARSTLAFAHLLRDGHGIYLSSCSLCSFPRTVTGPAGAGGEAQRNVHVGQVTASGCVRKRQSQLQRPDVCFADLTYSSAIR